MHPSFFPPLFSCLTAGHIRSARRAPRVALRHALQACRALPARGSQNGPREDVGDDRGQRQRADEQRPTEFRHHLPRSVRAFTPVPHAGQIVLPFGTRRRHLGHWFPTALGMAFIKITTMSTNSTNDPTDNATSGIEHPFVLSAAGFHLPSRLGVHRGATRGTHGPAVRHAPRALWALLPLLRIRGASREENCDDDAQEEHSDQDGPAEVIHETFLCAPVRRSCNFHT